MATFSSGMRRELADFEGLVFKTASMYERLLGYEREDLQQVLRLRVWIAIEAYDGDRSDQPLDKFVFGCVRNQIRDLVKSKTRKDRCHACNGSGCEVCAGRGRIVERESYIEDHTAAPNDRFEAAHLSHIEVHEHDEQVVLPIEVTSYEREVIGLLYVGYRQTEIADLLGCQRRDIERSVRIIRRKLADWHPGNESGEAEVIELEAHVRRALARAAA
jgi:RNA polymerase sigma factor (sigma-70 family)